MENNHTQEQSMSNYRLVLIKELERRKQANPRYSLRAFARSLKVDPSSLSRILRGQTTTTLQTALRMVNAMNLPPEERVQFLRSVAVDGRLKELDSMLSQL